MKFLIFLLLISPAFADELQIDLTGTALSTDGQTVVGPFDMQFMLDTSGGAQQLSGSGCMSGYNIQGATFSNVNLTLNGQSVMSGSGTGSYEGPENIDGLMQFSVGNDTFRWDYGGHGAYGCIAGTDPLATVFTSQRQTGGAGGSFQSESGYLNLEIENVSVRSVPEPGILPLFLLGLLFLWRRRES